MRCASTSRRTSANTGCGWSKVRATASCAPAASSALRRRDTRSPGRNGESQGTVAISAWLRVRERDVQARERPGESADRVGDHAVPERGVVVDVLVGVDQHLVDLRREALEHVRDHRPAVERDQPLVDAAHAPALSAGEHDTGDADRGNHDVADAAAGGLGHGIHATCSS